MPSERVIPRAERGEKQNGEGSSERAILFACRRGLAGIKAIHKLGTLGVDFNLDQSRSLSPRSSVLFGRTLRGEHVALSAFLVAFESIQSHREELLTSRKVLGILE